MELCADKIFPFESSSSSSTPLPSEIAVIAQKRNNMSTGSSPCLSLFSCIFLFLCILFGREGVIFHGLCALPPCSLCVR